MREGEIVLANLPQADGQRKTRPIVLLRILPQYDDFLACGVSTQIHQEVEGFDEIIEPTSTNRLRQTSLIRLGFLATVAQEQIKGSLGAIPETLHHALLERLAKYLKEV